MPEPAIDLLVDNVEVEVQFDRFPGGLDGFNGTLFIAGYDEATDTYTLEATGDVGFTTRFVTIEFDGIEYANIPLHTITPEAFYASRVTPGILTNTILLD